MWVLITAVMMACGQPVEGRDYRGEPLATLSGQMTAEEALDTGEGIRLALAWFPDTNATGPLSAPKSIVTEDVVYKGSFPLNYSFGLFKPPPPSAMGNWSSIGGPAHAAIGVLLAYQDRNGNGQLDTITATGVPVDHVLGASTDLFSTSGYAIVYTPEPAPADADPEYAGLKPGFNLMAAFGVVPASTQVPIKLLDQPDLDYFVCNPFFTGEQAPDLPCGISPRIPAAFAFLTLSDESARVQVYVGDPIEGTPVSNAAVSLDGKSVPEVEPGQYELDDTSRTLLVPGKTHAVRVQAPGLRTVEYRKKMPGDFAITSPRQGASFPTGEAISVDWTASSGSNEYYVTLSTEGGATLASTNTNALTWKTEAISHEGSAVLEIKATPGLIEIPVTAVVSRRAVLQFAP